MLKTRGLFLPTSVLTCVFVGILSWVVILFYYGKNSRPSYMVGCNPDGWSTYLRREYFYVFKSLQDDYGWKELDVHDHNNISSMLLKNPPKVILFCEQNLKLASRITSKNELQTKYHTVFAIHSDDTDIYNRYSTTEMIKILEDFDLMISAYAYQLPTYFSKLKPSQFPNFLWLPHSASPEFSAAWEVPYLNPNASMLLSGAHSEMEYPIRSYLHGLNRSSSSSSIVLYSHPGYGKHTTVNQNTLYAAAIRNSLVTLATTMLARRIVAKVFEIPATGSLLFVNLDLQYLLKNDLGMLDGIHYVGFNGSNNSSFFEKLDWVLDAVNYDKVNRIRENGMTLVKQRHLTSHRSATLNSWFDTGKYPSLPASNYSITSPCPMVGTVSLYECEYTYKRRFKFHRHMRNTREPAHPLLQDGV